VAGDETRTLHEPAAPLYGVRYQVNGGNVTLTPAQRLKIILPAPRRLKPPTGSKRSSFGCVRQFNGEITLQPVWSIAPTAAC
jgi:Lon-like ATP-dependent protease